jgi:hypothetical protein
MPVDSAILADNAAQLKRLETLIASKPDYSVDLGEGWTVSVALAHLAFWDRRAAYLLTHWQVGSPPRELDDDMLNTSLLDEWKALSGAASGKLALRAAREVTSIVKSLDSRVADDVSAQGYTWLMRRANHRREHLDQIEAALKR